MKTISNIIWLLFGGIETAITWAVLGILCYVTIIGIPFGRQCFKFAKLTLAPFGKTIVYGGGAPSMIANILWLIVGIPSALLYVIIAAAYAITIIGIPVAVQNMKMAKLSLMPFGAEVLEA